MSWLLLASTAAVAAGASAPPATDPGARPVLATFAPALADSPPLSGPEAWGGSVDEAWSALAASTPATRQAARWRLARALLGVKQFPEALGVLEAMRGDEADLGLVPAFALAAGAALAGTGRHREASAILDSPGLAANPEACAWRLRAAEAAGDPGRALGQVNCADHAIRTRDGGARTPFVLAAARAAVDGGRPAHALRWLGQLPEGDPNANLLRGRALRALGKGGEARLRFERVRRSGAEPVRLDATLHLLEGSAADPRTILRRAETIRFAWRGGPLERRAARLVWRAASRIGDGRAALAAGATLVRYHPPGPETAALLADLRGRLDAALAPGSPVPLPEAAGLFWEHRDLLPAGADGDRLAQALAERLASAGLYRQAAVLLEHQLLRRAEDLAKGPLSVRVATLHVLAGDARRALTALRKSAGPTYTPPMRHARAEVESVALAAIGRTDEALAVLDDLPGAGPLRAELLWRGERWDAYVAAAALPGTGRLDPAGQAAVLRQAVALASLGREGELQALRARYAGRFGGSPAERAFALLTGSADVAGADIAEALAAMPDASPAGEAADLLDAAALAVR